MNRDVLGPRASPGTPTPDQTRWLGLRRDAWVLASLGAGAVMGTMNSTIMNTVLPVIGESFGADLSSIEWVLMSYLLTTSVLLMTFGRLGDIWGHKRVYILGLIVFVLASGLCSLSPTEAFLIGARCLQAIGGAMVVANAQAILTRSFPPERRGQLLGTFYAIASLGILIGPSLGGYVTYEWGWRSVFYVSIVIGTVTAIASWRILPDVGPGQTREPFDLLGASILGIGLGALLLAISKGQEAGWTSPFTLGLTAVSVALLALFWRVESTRPYPMLDTALFRNREFFLATTCAFIAFICIYCGQFLTPFYLLQGRHFSPSLTGQIYSVQPLGMLITTPIGGYLSDRIGSRLLSTLGALGIAAGLFALHNLGAESGLMEILLSFGLVGLGNGLFVGPNANTIMSSAPSQSQGVAAGIVSTARNLGMVFGIALTGAILALQIAQRSAVDADPQAALLGSFQDTFFAMSLIAIACALIAMVKGTARPSSSLSHRSG